MQMSKHNTLQYKSVFSSHTRYVHHLYIYTFYNVMQEEVHANIGKGIAMLGPTMTLDTVVEVLLISIGTISGQWKH